MSEDTDPGLTQVIPRVKRKPPIRHRIEWGAIWLALACATAVLAWCLMTTIRPPVP